MRLYFEEPKGDRLALDTERREWSATYETEDTEIDDEHFFIHVDDIYILQRIEQEADFCGYGYNKELADETKGPQTSVYTEYLQKLARYSAGIDKGIPYSAELMNHLHDDIERARATGYFNALQYSILTAALNELCDELEPYDAEVDAEEEDEPF